jgi:serine phosphatase RsbU (regulator of sigma subunit)
MKLLLLLLILNFGSVVLWGQNTPTWKIDIEASQPDTATVMKILKTVAKMPDSLYFQRMDYTEKALKIATQINFDIGIAYAHRRLGLLHYAQSNFAEAIQHLYRVVEMGEKVVVKDKNFFPSLLQLIGKIHERQNNITKAEEYYQKAFQRNSQANNKHLLALDYSNLANVESLKGNYDKSLEYRNLEQKTKEELKDTLGLAFTLHDVAVMYLQQQKYKEAADYFRKALKTTEYMPLNIYKVAFHVSLSEACRLSGNIAEAKELATKALAMATQLQNKLNAVLATQVLHECYNLQKDYKNAYQFLLLNKQLQDSVYNEKHLKEIANMENNFEIKQQKKANDLLQKENELKIKELAIKDEEATKNKWLAILAVLVGGMLAVLAVVLYKNNMAKKKSNDLLTAKNQEIHQQKEEIVAIANNLQTANTALSLSKVEIEKKNEDILASINYAKRIQGAILPFDSVFEQYFGKDNFFIFYQPKDIVSGDFYWLSQVQLPNETVTVVAAVDCTGHGVPGAFMSLIGNNLLDEIVNTKTIISPADILLHLNQGVRRLLKQDETNNRDGMDMVLLALHQTATNQPYAVYAGAMNALYYVQNKQLREIKATKMGIGGYYAADEARVFENHTIVLDTTTTFYLASDGYQDQFGGAANRKFMVKNLRSTLENISVMAMTEQKSFLQTTLNNWKGQNKQIDDVMVLGLRVVV